MDRKGGKPRSKPLLHALFRDMPQERSREARERLAPGGESGCDRPMRDARLRKRAGRPGKERADEGKRERWRFTDGCRNGTGFDP